MAESCFAQLTNGVVQRVIVADKSFIDSGVVGAGWVTAQAKTFAGVGSTFDAGRNAFIAERTFPSWLLDEQTCQWKAPKAAPESQKMMIWSEADLDWINVKEVVK